ncbi:hypothetical protein GQ457_05G023310 [Hibiscus cannabinus]
MPLMHNKVPAKKTDPGSFTIDCLVGHNYPTKALCDPGASINLMPKFVFQKLGIKEAKPTTVMLQLADHSYVQPEGGGLKIYWSKWTNYIPCRLSDFTLDRAAMSLRDA